ncbi:MAG: hypothetical protein EHM70_21795, partial [Chloroflexota bacterium]
MAEAVPQVLIDPLHLHMYNGDGVPSMRSYQLYCLGQPILELDGKPVRLETRKSLALLVYLRLCEHDVSRESLATLFWPEYDQQHAQANLRRALSSLNISLQKELLEADRVKISLTDRSKVWVDVEQFQRLRAAAQEHPHSSELTCPNCLDDLNEAQQLYRGDFLEGFNLPDCPEFDQWQFLQRESLRQDWGQVLQKLAEANAAQAKWESAIAFARRWVALDRLHEPASRLLIDIYARAGQRTAALRQYDELAHSLEEQLGQQPSQETRQYAEKIKLQGQAVRNSPALEPVAIFPVLKTKLYIPTPPNRRVSRRDLVKRLDQVEHKALTVI